MPESFDYTGLFSENPQASGQAGTAVLPDSTIMNDYWKFSEMQFLKDKFNYEKQQADIQERLKALDFDTAGLFPEDREEIRKKKENLINFVYENPEAINPRNEKYGEYEKLADDIDYNINKLKADKAYYDLGISDIATGKLSPIHRADYDTFRKAGITREYPQLTPDIEDNALADAQSLEKILSKGNPTISLTPKGYGYVESTTTTPLETNDLEKALQVMYLGSQKKQDVAKQFFDNMSQETRDELSIKNPYDAFRYSRIKSMKLSPDIESKLLEINYAPTSGGSGNKTSPDLIQKRKDLIYRIQNKDEGALDIFRGLKYSGVPVQSVEYEKFDDPNHPTTIKIVTQPTSEYGEGKTIRLEVSDKTGGGFYAINQFLNDLEGQEKISVEDLEKIPEHTSQQQKTSVKTVVKTGTYKGKKVVQYSDGTIEYAE